MFGVDDLFACDASLHERGLAPTALAVEGVQALSTQQISDLIARHDQVITL